MAGDELHLGWHSYCLGVESVPAMLDYYVRLGFSVVGGQPEHGWVGLNNEATDLSMVQGLPAHCLNFRGADVAALAAEHRRRGFEPVGYAEYDPGVYPAEWHTDEEGRALPLDGSASYTLADPDGNTVMFDTVPLERARQLAGQRFCMPVATGELLPDQKVLGRHDLCLNVADLVKSLEFYARVGLEVEKDRRSEGWALLTAGELRLGLYQGHIERNCMNFRGADVFAVAARMKADGLTIHRGPEIEADGSAGAWLEDPEGNAIYLNTAPGEKRAGS